MSSTDEEEEESPEPLATTRARRVNAGNRMSTIIQDEDNFYESLYGGFHEEEDDADFDSEEDDEDEVDSDFSIDETDEIAPEHQEVEDEPKKKRGVYKDPAKLSKPVPSTSTPGPQPKPKSPHKIRSFRDSTKKKTEETIEKIKAGTRKKKKVRKLEDWKPLSQEEMLAEAKKTEAENLKSLELYQRLESEKLKKLKQIKKTLPPPYVTYFSTTMPVLGTDKRYSRNFLTFVT